jgi:hypothetical protein
MWYIILLVVKIVLYQIPFLNGTTNFADLPCAHVETYAAQGRPEIHLSYLI